jgi:hypothetical protein
MATWLQGVDRAACGLGSVPAPYARTPGPKGSTILPYLRPGATTILAYLFRQQRFPLSVRGAQPASSLCPPNEAGNLSGRRSPIPAAAYSFHPLNPLHPRSTIPLSGCGPEERCASRPSCARHWLSACNLIYAPGRSFHRPRSSTREAVVRLFLSTVPSRRP